MNKLKGINKRSWLSTPYLIWIIGFTVIPMAVIFRYALRWFYTGECGGYRRSGSFKSGDLLFRNCGGMHIDLYFIILSACARTSAAEPWKTGICTVCTDPADVDEFYPPCARMADDLIEQRNPESSAAKDRT